MKKNIIKLLVAFIFFLIFFAVARYLKMEGDHWDKRMPIIMSKFMKHDSKIIAGYIDDYFRKCQKIPKSTKDLFEDKECGVDSSGLSDSLIRDGYSRFYIIEVLESNKEEIKYKIISLGRDGQVGGEDRDADTQIHLLLRLK